jgi:ATP-dependent Clp protease ATP-binding subunit ClpC
MIKELIKRAEGQDIRLEITPRVKEKLVEEGYNPSYGARPLRRAVMRLVEDNIASKFLQEYPEGQVSIIVDLDENDEIIISLKPISLPTIETEIEKPTKGVNDNLQMDEVDLKNLITN